MSRLPDLLGTLPRQVERTPYEIVFVCTGNICRSPMAEVVTKILAEATVLPDGTTLGDRLIITSAGTGPWHEGEPMDPRASAALLRAGYPDYPHVAHQISVPRLKTDQSDPGPRRAPPADTAQSGHRAVPLVSPALIRPFMREPPPTFPIRTTATRPGSTPAWR